MLSLIPTEVNRLHLPRAVIRFPGGLQLYES